MIFITGGTGFLGNAIVTQILTRYPNERVAVLVRAENDDIACRKLYQSFSHLRDRVNEKTLRSSLIPVRGDLSEDNLGISDYNRSLLHESIQSIYHSAANTHLGLSYEESKATNLDGTVRVLALASEISERNSRLRFNHISTAYVAGDTSSIVTADRLELNKRFRNSYEETKAKAESLVRAHSNKFTTVIYRPSIIVGDSRTGITSTFNVVYIPARIIIMGLLKVIPALPHIPFDVVPVDYVAESIANAHGSHIPTGSAFHLTAGVGRESSPAEVLDLLFSTAKHYSSKRLPQKPVFIAPELMQKAMNSVSNIANNIYHTSVYKQFEKIASDHIPVFKQLLPFVPYMISNPRFDTEATLESLENIISPAPLFNQYAENIFRYCIQTQWGKQMAPMSV
jgi:thioester reductase-like protein